VIAGAAFGLLFGSLQAVFGTLKRGFLATVLVESVIFAAVIGAAWVIFGLFERFASRNARPS
jgi:hypothetical protein